MTVVRAFILSALAILLLEVPAGGRGADETRGDRRLGLIEPQRSLTLGLALRLPRSAELGSFLDRLGDPGSSDYRGYVTAREFGQRFGLPERVISKIATRLGGLGFEVRPAAQRTSLAVHGPAHAVERLFGVRLATFRDSHGVTYHAPIGSPLVPEWLAPVVTGVSGLDTRPMLLPAAVPTGSGLRPIDIERAYNVSQLRALSLAGEGQTVAIVGFGPFSESDVAEFDKTVGIVGAPSVERIPLTERTETEELAHLETALDIDVIRGIAPQAQILVYEIDLTTTNIALAIERIVQDGRADIVSISGGSCDVPVLANGNPSLSRETRLLGEQAIASAVAAGVSIFVSSGDYGAHACRQADETDLRLATKWPENSPGVVSVGGTRLSTGLDGSYLSEDGWEDVLSISGSGGGFNPEDARPEWQRAPGVDNADSNGMRQVPDVAGPGDPDSGFLVVFQGETIPVGGTSAAAPFWAGIMVLVRQLAEREGVGPLGFVNPMLYALASGASSPFHDVVRGGNLHYNAGPGWDYATGLGSPDAALLGPAVVEYLRPR